MNDNNTENHETEVRKSALKVWVNDEEKEAIKHNIALVGKMSVSAYLRNLGLGYFPKSKIDKQIILDLAKINADQGRLGGLLKMLLSNKEIHNTSTFIETNKILKDIQKTQNKLLETVSKL